MMMQPAIRAMFMPNPPPKFVPKPVLVHRSKQLTGVAAFLQSRAVDVISNKNDATNKEEEEGKNGGGKNRKQQREERQKERNKRRLEPMIEDYRTAANASEGSFEGMNCYNTIFVGRLAFEVSEHKLLREFEHYGPVKDLKLICDKESGKSKGYAFIEFEKEEDMRRAFRAADGMKIEGRPIVVDVERGHTVPNWLPRRLGGGLGGTRIGGKHENVNVPGRWDPAMARMMQQQPPPGRDPMYDGYSSRPMDGPERYGGYGRGPPNDDYHRGPPPPRYNDRRYDDRDRDRDRGRDSYSSFSRGHRSGDKRRRSRSRDRGDRRPRW